MDRVPQDLHSRAEHDTDPDARYANPCRQAVGLNHNADYHRRDHANSLGGPEARRGISE